ncbi:MAG: Gfo/Idh/MocA family oxidoreductase [Planctomycetota bacterium]|nr:Gfo/Idh/MocA family oxidoreductase [Planctomycetota bacterium]MDA1165394.1 Gfo/Idh/MocA family oxidoreductase [Planctomycetota bacterium]
MAADIQTGNSRRDAPPLRIATVGIARDAVFHLEAAAIRDGLEPVAAARAGETNRTDEPVPGCVVCSLDELVERSDIDVVFVCGPVESRVDTAVRLLQRGLHVVVESSAAIPPDQVQRLSFEASTITRYCSVWRPWDSELDFRRAAHVAASGEAGPIRAVRFLQHQLVAAMLPHATSKNSREQISNATLQDLAGHRLAQALTLLDEPVKSVTAGFRRESVGFGIGESAREVTPAGENSLHAVIEFVGGASVLLDISIAAVVPISTGWIVQGTRGGYRSDRQYITVEDGEIYDVAVVVESLDPYQRLRTIITSWPNETIQVESQERLQLEFRVAKLLARIRDSNRLSQMLIGDTASSTSLF